MAKKKKPSIQQPILSPIPTHPLITVSPTKQFRLPRRKRNEQDICITVFPKDDPFERISQLLEIFTPNQLKKLLKNMKKLESNIEAQLLLKS